MTTAATLRAAERRAQRWRNGGGVTREVALGELADNGSFDWRVSMAEVAAPGPFSTFPEVDRTLAVLEGKLELEIEGRPSIVLDPTSAPIDFPGDVLTHGLPVGGRVLDLNVMVRRGVWHAAVESLQGSGKITPCNVVIIVAKGLSHANNARLDRHDAELICDGGSAIAYESEAGIVAICLNRLVNQPPALSAPPFALST